MVSILSPALSFSGILIPACPNSFPHLLSLKVTAAAPSLAPTKALKLGASAMPRMVAQSPTGGPQTLEAAATKLREALARGASGSGHRWMWATPARVA